MTAKNSNDYHFVVFKWAQVPLYDLLPRQPGPLLKIPVSLCAPWEQQASLWVWRWPWPLCRAGISYLWTNDSLWPAERGQKWQPPHLSRNRREILPSTVASQPEGRNGAIQSPQSCVNKYWGMELGDPNGLGPEWEANPSLFLTET